MLASKPATAAIIASYERPVEARLVVVAANGEKWDATADDMKRFGFIRPGDAYMRFHDWLCKVLDLERTTDSALSVIRYAVECAIHDYGHMPGYSGEDDDERMRREVRLIERAAATVEEDLKREGFDVG